MADDYLAVNKSYNSDSRGYKLREYIDLFQADRELDWFDFDDLARVIEFVIGKSEALALDNAGDRAILVQRLLVALGSVPYLPGEKNE